LDLDLERGLLLGVVGPWRPAPPPLPLVGVLGVGGLVVVDLDFVVIPAAWADELLVILWLLLFILCWFLWRALLVLVCGEILC